MAAVVLVSIVVVVGEDLSVLNVKMKLKKNLRLEKTNLLRDVREKNLFDVQKLMIGFISFLCIGCDFEDIQECLLSSEHKYSSNIPSIIIQTK